MEAIPVVLLYEAARFHPQIIATLEVLNKSISRKISRDPCFIQTLLEDEY